MQWNGIELATVSARRRSVTASVFAIEPYGAKIYAGGNFVNAGGKAAADYLAVFDGISWKPFCNSTRGPAFDSAGLQVRALQVVGSTLYVGGTFQNANGDKRADYLIACDLATGAPRPTVDTDGDFTGAVYALAATSDGTLYAGGTFTNLDRLTTADGVAAYTPDGGWQGLGASPIGGIVRGLHAKGTDLYISSDGLNIGGIAQADHLVKWDGSGYTAVGSNTAGTNGYFPSTTYINALTSSWPLLFAAGSWQNADGQPTADVIAYFDGTCWRPLARTAPERPWVGDTQALAVFNGQLYAGGALTKPAETSRPTSRVALASVSRRRDRHLHGELRRQRRLQRHRRPARRRRCRSPRGTSKFFPVLVQNDGPLPASYKVEGRRRCAGHSVTYINYGNGANITTAVRNGTFSTGNARARDSLSR